MRLIVPKLQFDMLCISRILLFSITTIIFKYDVIWRYAARVDMDVFLVV